MYSLPKYNRLSLFFFILLLGGSLHAQLSKGFRLLSSNEPEGAKEVFTALLAQPGLQAAAHYGLALATQKTLRSVHDLMTAHTLMEKAVALGTEVSPKQKSQWIKRRWYASNPMPAFYQKLMTDAFRSYTKPEQLPQVDSLQDFIYRTSSRQAPKTRIDSLQQRLLRSYAASAIDDYQGLSYLIGRHPEALQRISGLRIDQLNTQLLSSYLRQFRGKDMDRFRRENPAYPLLNDPSFDAFSRCLLDGSLAARLQFCIDHEASMLTDWLLDHLAADESGEEAGLSQQQQLLLAGIRRYSASRNPQGRPPVPGQEDIERYQQDIAMLAPNKVGLLALKEAMRLLLHHRLWDDALQLATTARDLYLHCAGCPSPSPYQSWFDNLMPLLEQPAQGIRPMPLEQINTREGTEAFPVISADGQRLYFGGANRPDNLYGEDTFVASRDAQGQWSSPRLVPNLSGEGNYGCNAITTDGREMMVFVNGRLCVSQQTANGWSSPQVINSISAHFTWIGQTSYADNGRIILLEGRRPNSTNIDIFASRRDSSGHWQQPFPLGSVINTPGSDRSPFMHADNRSLYFSSDGHGGLGKMDVFMTTRLDDSWTLWSKPVNVGKELNTLDDDLGFTITASGKEIYLSSVPDANPRHSYDLYIARLPDYVRPRPQQIVNLKIRQAPGVSIPVVATDATGNRIADGFTLPDGTLNMTFPADAVRPITFLSASAQNIFVPVVLGAVDSTHEVIYYESTVEVFDFNEFSSGERSLKTRGIFFASDADTLAAEALVELRAIYQLLRDKGLRIEVAGYADPDGSNAYNLQLSQRRANRVQAQLIAWGYPAEKVVAVGYGVPVTGSVQLNAEQKADCRRVEVRVKN